MITPGESMRRLIVLVESVDDDDEADLSGMAAAKAASDKERHKLAIWNGSAYKRWQERAARIALPPNSDQFLAPYPIPLVRGDKDGNHLHEVEVIATIKGTRWDDMDDDSHRSGYEYHGMVDAFIHPQGNEPPLTAEEIEHVRQEIESDESVIYEMLNDEYTANRDDFWHRRHWMDPR